MLLVGIRRHRLKHYAVPDQHLATGVGRGGVAANAILTIDTIIDRNAAVDGRQ